MPSNKYCSNILDQLLYALIFAVLTFVYVHPLKKLNTTVDLKYHLTASCRRQVKTLNMTILFYKECFYFFKYMLLLCWLPQAGQLMHIDGLQPNLMYWIRDKLPRLNVTREFEFQSSYTDGVMRLYEVNDYYL